MFNGVAVHPSVFRRPMVSLKVVFFSLGYADDMATLSPSASGLQKLLNICASYATKHDIIYNVKKTQCMVIPSTKFKLQNTPSFFKWC